MSLRAFFTLRAFLSLRALKFASFCKVFMLSCFYFYQKPSIQLLVCKYSNKNQTLTENKITKITYNIKQQEPTEPVSAHNDHFNRDFSCTCYAFYSVSLSV